MSVIAITIVGLTPLLCGRPAEIDPSADARTQATERLYRDVDGQAVIPGINLRRCLIGAGRFVGREPAELVHALGLGQSQIPIIAPTPWVVDSRSVRDPRTGARSICHRPRFDVWTLNALLHVDQELLPLAAAAALVDEAGRRVGLGDFRPECGGPFGTFRVTAWGR